MAAQSFLLTRPAAASARFARSLKESFGADIHVVISPLMTAVFLTHPLPPGPFDAVILTSETAAEAARRISAEQVSLPVRAFCVGDRTAQVATEAGFLTLSAAGDADALVALIQSRLPHARFLHLRGRDGRGNIAERLNSGGSETYEAIVYDQRPCPLNAAATALLAGPDPIILPLFSPRSADLMVQTGPARAPLWVAALSPAVAVHAAPLKPDRIAIAAQPNAASMLQTLHCFLAAGRQT